MSEKRVIKYHIDDETPKEWAENELNELKALSGILFRLWDRVSDNLKADIFDSDRDLFDYMSDALGILWEADYEVIKEE